MKAARHFGSLLRVSRPFLDSVNWTSFALHSLSQPYDIQLTKVSQRSCSDNRPCATAGVVSLKTKRTQSITHGHLSATSDSKLPFSYTLALLGVKLSSHTTSRRSGYKAFKNESLHLILATTKVRSPRANKSEISGILLDQMGKDITLREHNI